MTTTYDFNPPSPCGEGQHFLIVSAKKENISIHPPRVGRDHSSTVEAAFFIISIHPPRVGRDSRLYQEMGDAEYFNPPSPCGEGHRGQDLRWPP